MKIYNYLLGIIVLGTINAAFGQWKEEKEQDFTKKIVLNNYIVVDPTKKSGAILSSQDQVILNAMKQQQELKKAPVRYVFNKMTEQKPRSVNLAIKVGLPAVQFISTPVEALTKTSTMINEMQNGSEKVDLSVQEELRNYLALSNLGKKSEKVALYKMQNQKKLFCSAADGNTWVNLDKFLSMPKKDRKKATIQEGNYKALYGPFLQIVIPGAASTGILYGAKKYAGIDFSVFSKNRTFQKSLGWLGLGAVTFHVMNKMTQEGMKKGIEKGLFDRAFGQTVHICTYQDDEQDNADNKDNAVNK